MSLHPKIHFTVDITSVAPFEYDELQHGSLVTMDEEGTEYLRRLLTQQFGEFEGRVSAVHTLAEVA